MLFNDLRDANGTLVNSDSLQSDIQGNILRGYCKARTLVVFLRFGLVPADNRAWVRDHVLGGALAVTRATDQGKGGVEIGFSLTASGLQRLDCPAAALSQFEPAFLRGAQSEATRRRLGDPPLERWEPSFQRGWDAALLVSHGVEDGPAVQSQVRAACASNPAIREYLLQEGNVLDHAGAPVTKEWTHTGARFEPFGYRDGISTPVFSQEHADELSMTSRELKLQQRSLSNVLVRDPLAENGYGTYVVFRKLFQDVKAFKERLQYMVARLKTRGPELNRLWGGKDSVRFGCFAGGAGSCSDADIEDFVRQQIMGRSADGTPATLGKASGKPTNDFDYSDDDGRRCPFAAHARKMAPRLAYADHAIEASHSIVRRGTAFGRADDQVDSAVGAGLLFLCAQSSIANQFEFMQACWANDSERDLDLEPTPMRDNLAASVPAGDWTANTQPTAQNRDDVDARFGWLTETMEFDFKMYDLVTLRGAEYLFSPSVSGLARLCGGE